MKSGKGNKGIHENYLHQISILRSLVTQGCVSPAARPIQLAEIAEECGLSDEKEVQRYLYILEGQKLVSPHPTGDFTSKIWYITQDGVRALKGIANAGFAGARA